MKQLLFILVLASFSGLAFAEESHTECTMMKEQNERTNPKANDKVKIKETKTASSSAQ